MLRYSGEIEHILRFSAQTPPGWSPIGSRCGLQPVVSWERRESASGVRKADLREIEALRRIYSTSAQAEPAAIEQGLNKPGSDRVQPPQSLPTALSPLCAQLNCCSWKRTPKSGVPVADTPVDRSKV